MKKLICALMCLFLLVAFSACSHGSDSSGASSEETVSPPKVPVINGVSISEFTVYYDNNEKIAQKFKTVAEELVSYVKQTFDITLEMKPDTYTDHAENAIFIGGGYCDTNRNDFDHGEYKILIKGTKVLLSSSYANGSHAALEELIKMIESSEDGMFNDQEFTGEKHIIRVACVGDSITQGINSADPQTMTYPAYIQQMLGLDYYVGNYGLSGYSICKIDEYSYFKHETYQNAKDFKPDVVLFALGTNDANPDPYYKSKDWTDPANNRVEVFKQSTNELLDSFIEVNPDVQIFMILPASLFKVGNDSWKAEPWTANIVKYSHPLLKEIAEARNLPIVDLFDWSIEHKEVFTDGLHPKNETYKTFAQYIYDCIKDTIKTEK